MPVANDTPRHFTTMASRAVAWDKGSADLQLLVRGDLSNPIANGFLRLKEGEIRFIGQTIRQIEATVLFDFDQLLLQELTASVGSKGKISGEGKIGLVQPQWPEGVNHHVVAVSQRKGHWPHLEVGTAAVVIADLTQ